MVDISAKPMVLHSGHLVPLDQSTPLDTVLAAFLPTLESPSTRRAYGRHLRESFGAMEAIQPGDVTSCRLKAWREHLLQDGRSPSTHAQAISAMRSFLHWVADEMEQNLPNAILRSLKVPKARVERTYEVLNESELSELLALAEDHHRDRAILAVLFGAGLRASEVVALNAKDLLLDASGEWYLAVRQAKGQKDRHVPLRADVAAAIRAYLAFHGRGARDPGALFFAEDRAAKSRPDRRMTSRALGYLVQRYVGRANIQGKVISPHSCRHTFALRALRQGADVVALSEILGHTQITTTQIYVKHLHMEDLRKSLPTLPLRTS